MVGSFFIDNLGIGEKTMFRYFNSNPTKNIRVGDCAVRALSKALGITWDDAYDILSDNAKQMGDMPDSKIVMTATLLFPECHHQMED